ncbi:MAG: DMT family transporter [Thiohalocapsa sp.]|jgi:drug/metabolite transporter (DMT)-like permease|uniref:DMT family transporter n=1 Tax=Thiohalocapsa sp. TaxID=2497641 RepID=UPI0025DA6179|nr:DMT family transporter [Thiohalocapsa sp.]MCG6939704.1 DMT family transporter [Thiohalocapsa sp.]
MDWLLLALLSAASLASADAATKAWLRDYSATEISVVRFSAAGLLLSPLLIGMPAPWTLPAPFWGWLAAMLPLEIASMLLYMAAIRDHPLALTVPYLAFTPVFVLGIADWLLGERVSAQGAAGVLLVVAGAWLLNVRHARLTDVKSWAAPLAAIFREPGSRMMLAVALMYAFTATMGKAVLIYLPARYFGPFYFLVLGLVMPLVWALPLRWHRVAARRAGQPMRRLSLRGLLRRPGAVAAVAALNGVMVYAHFLAIARVEVAYMVAVKRTSLLFGILYGALVFGETGLRTHLAAGALMVAGVVVIVMS